MFDANVLTSPSKRSRRHYAVYLVSHLALQVDAFATAEVTVTELKWSLREQAGCLTIAVLGSMI